MRIPNSTTVVGSSAEHTSQRVPTAGLSTASRHPSASSSRLTAPTAPPSAAAAAAARASRGASDACGEAGTARSTVGTVSNPQLSSLDAACSDTKYALWHVAASSA